MCNWHAQFLAGWMIDRKTVVESIVFANSLAMNPGSSPPMDTSASVAVVRLAPNGTPETVTFDPAKCLKVFGFGDLHFNDYNTSGSFP